MTILNLAAGRRRSPRPEVITTALASPHNQRFLRKQGAQNPGFRKDVGVFLCARHGADLGGVSPQRADWPEPLAEGNCVAVRWGGKEAGSKARSRLWMSPAALAVFHRFRRTGPGAMYQTLSISVPALLSPATSAGSLRRIRGLALMSPIVINMRRPTAAPWAKTRGAVGHAAPCGSDRRSPSGKRSRQGTVSFRVEAPQPARRGRPSRSDAVNVPSRGRRSG